MATSLIIETLEAHLIPAETTRVALVVPLSGVLGLVGPCAVNCATLAADEVNASGGVLGRPVELVLVDGGRAPGEVAAEVGALVAARAVQAVVGIHASDVRLAVGRAIGGRAPYVYTPPYEGGGRAPGVYYLGETAGDQVTPAIDWLVGHRRARRWFLVGNDYVWPRLVHAAARPRLPVLVGERFIPYGLASVERLLEEIAAARPDAILLTLIGSDLIRFNRAYARSGLTCARLCGALEEHGLLGIGGDDTGDLYASMGYFGSLTTDAGLSLAERYAARFGPHAPALNAHGHGSYEGVRMVAALAARAGSFAVPAFDRHADGTTVVGGRGEITLTGRHVRKRVYLGRADGLGFDVITSV
ncbi:substrate-binding domain-containing protein [Streptosporangiaceae bacterium NEAU-GS5]|nr:substrate-binding domain-containing protein [Streptosporangiaceae bacterium NEAU-GS5]